MVIITDPHVAVLTTHACLLQGRWLTSTYLSVIGAWWQLIHGAITDWDFVSVWNHANGTDDPYHAGNIMKFVQDCLGHSA